jgi:hypothetical protein
VGAPGGGAGPVSAGDGAGPAGISSPVTASTTPSRLPAASKTWPVASTSASVGIGSGGSAWAWAAAGWAASGAQQVAATAAIRRSFLILVLQRGGAGATWIPRRL